MSALALLAGVLVAGAVWLLLDDESWRRLIGLALLGDAMALLIVSAGAGAPAAIRAAITLMMAAFALFLAYASFVRISRRGSSGARREERGP